MNTSPDVSDQGFLRVREALKSSLSRWTTQGDQLNLPIPALSLYHRTAPTELDSCIYELCLALIVQGTKRVLLGGEEYIYGPDLFLISAVDMLTASQVIEATPEKPYMSLMLRLDLSSIVKMMEKQPFTGNSLSAPRRAMATAPVTLPLLQAVQRLVDLLDHPQDIPILAPLIEQEILYRLLTSEQGNRLRQMAVVGSQGHGVGRAVQWLKEHFCEAFFVEDLAESMGMSASTFHRHFREITGMTPVQYQKILRLNEAKRLMLSERIDAASAAFRVGYESPSHFSRDYRRQFGLPPASNVHQLRSAPGMVLQETH